MALGDNLQVWAVPFFGSTAENLGIEQGFDITQVEVPTDRPIDPPRNGPSLRPWCCWA